MAGSLFASFARAIRGLFGEPPAPPPKDETPPTTPDRLIFMSDENRLDGLFEPGALPILRGEFEGRPAGSLVHVDRHPTEPLLAIEVYAEGHGEAYVAAVWHAASGELVLAPEGAWAARWASDGSGLWVARSASERDPSRLELVQVPGGNVVRSIPFAFPTGWPTRLFVNRARSLAAVVFNEQDAGGYVLVKLGDADGVVEGGTLLAPGEQGAFAGPIESLDGNTLISAMPIGWYVPEGEEIDLDALEEEELDVATVYLQDLTTLEVREVLVRPAEPEFHLRRGELEESRLVRLELDADGSLKLVTAAGTVHEVPRASLSREG